MKIVFVNDEVARQLREWSEPAMLQLKIVPVEAFAGDVVELEIKRIYDFDGLVEAYRERGSTGSTTPPAS